MSYPHPYLLHISDWIHSSKVVKRSGSLPASRAGPCQLLQLPMEVRMVIYMYLVPTEKSYGWCGAPRRHDGLCYPAALSTCRTIYQELHGEWYRGDFTYEVDISSNGMFLLGQHHPLLDPPPVFGLIRSLCIRIELEWRPNRQYEIKRLMALLSTPETRLRKLCLHIHSMHPWHTGRDATRAVCMRTLQRTLSPIRKITWLKAAKVDVLFDDPYRSMHPRLKMSPRADRPAKETLESYVTEYLHNLVAVGSEGLDVCKGMWNRQQMPLGGFNFV